MIYVNDGDLVEEEEDIDGDEPASLDDDLLSEAEEEDEALVDEVEGFGLEEVEEKEELEDEEDMDGDESLEEDAEDVDYDSFDDVDEL
jgi:hypothetical protein